MTYETWVLKEQKQPKTLLIFELPGRLKGKGSQVLALPYGKNGIETPIMMDREDLYAAYDEVPNGQRMLGNLAKRNKLGVPTRFKKRSTTATAGLEAGIKPVTERVIYTPKGNARPDMTGGGKQKAPLYIRKARPRLQAVPHYPSYNPITGVDNLTAASARWLGAVIHKPNSPIRELVEHVDAPFNNNKGSIAQNQYARLTKGGLVERRARLVADGRGHMSEILHYNATHKGNTVWSQWVDKQRELARPKAEGEAIQPSA